MEAEAGQWSCSMGPVSLCLPASAGISAGEIPLPGGPVLLSGLFLFGRKALKTWEMLSTPFPGWGRVGLSAQWVAVLAR